MHSSVLSKVINVCQMTPPVCPLCSGLTQCGCSEVLWDVSLGCQSSEEAHWESWPPTTRTTGGATYTSLLFSLCQYCPTLCISKNHPLMSGKGTVMKLFSQEIWIIKRLLLENRDTFLCHVCNTSHPSTKIFGHFLHNYFIKFEEYVPLQGRCIWCWRWVSR